MSGVFRFKKFNIEHVASAMKVVTDAVLLGSWTKLPFTDARIVEDVGSGTGIIVLMMVQREPLVEVVGYEIDQASAREGQKNMTQSPWGDRCRCICGDWKSDRGNESVDLIVSNPPYFMANDRMAQGERKQARQEVSLSLADLISLAYARTSARGSLAIVIPSERLQEVLNLASQTGWFLWRRTEVSGKPSAPPIRMLIQWSKEERTSEWNSFSVYGDNGRWSPEYAELTREFYL